MNVPKKVFIVFVMIAFFAYYMRRRRCAQQLQKLKLAQEEAQVSSANKPVKPPPLRVPDEAELGDVEYIPDDMYVVKKVPPPNVLPSLPAAVGQSAAPTVKADSNLLRTYIRHLRDLQPRLKDQLLDANIFNLRSTASEVERNSDVSRAIKDDLEIDYYTILILAHEQWRALAATAEGERQLNDIVKEFSS